MPSTAGTGTAPARPPLAPSSRPRLPGREAREIHIRCGLRSRGLAPPRGRRPGSRHRAKSGGTQWVRSPASPPPPTGGIGYAAGGCGRGRLRGRTPRLPADSPVTGGVTRHGGVTPAVTPGSAVPQGMSRRHTLDGRASHPGATRVRRSRDASHPASYPNLLRRRGCRGVAPPAGTRYRPAVRRYGVAGGRVRQRSAQRLRAGM